MNEIKLNNTLKEVLEIGNYYINNISKKKLSISLC